MKHFVEIAVAVVLVMLPINQNVFARGKNLNNTNFEEKMYLPCKFEVLPYSAEYFVYWLKTLRANFAQLRLKFATNYTSTNDVILPSHWVWTYAPNKGSFRYLKWPMDFKILSLGLLGGSSLKCEIDLYMNVTPGNCDVELGNYKTSLMVGKAMLELSKKYFRNSDLPDDYGNSFWCYYSEENGFRSSYRYYLGRNFVFPVMGVGYKCCKQFKNIKENKFKFLCYRSSLQFWSQLVMIPYVLGIFFSVYFPIYLMKLSHSFLKSGKDIKRKDEQIDEIETDDGVPTTSSCKQLLTRVSANITNNEDFDNMTQTDDVMKYVFLHEGNPVSLARYICGICTLADYHPVCVSRFRRIILIFISPLVIYIQLIAYYSIMNDSIVAFIDHDVPVGFLSMLGGFDKSRANFLPYLGGPYITLLVYHIFGLFLILWPKDVSHVLQKGLPVDTKEFKSLITLDLSTIEKLSLYPCRKYTNFAKIHRVYLANIYMIINPKTWSYFVRFQYNRFTACCGQIFKRNSLRCLSLMKLFVFIPYVVVCLIEIILAIFYYFCPVISFVFCATRGYVYAMSDMLRNKSMTLKIMLTVLFAVVCLYFIFTMCLVLIGSFAFIGKILVFLYLAVIVFPSASFGCIFFTGSLIFYIFGITKSFHEEYAKLLLLTVKISEKIDEENKQKSEPHVNTSMEQSVDLEISEIINVTEVPAGAKTFSNQISTARKRLNYNKIVRYNKADPGIPLDLFNNIVNLLRPVHIQIFKSLLEIGFVFMLAFVSLVLISRLHRMSDVSSIMHIMSILVLGFVPKILQSLTKTRITKLEKDKLERKMLLAIKGYYYHSINN